MNTQGKIWGITQNLFCQNNVQIDRIEAKSGGYSSKHKHLYKYNMFFLESGEIDVYVWKNDYDLLDITTLMPNQATVVKPNEYHRFLAKKDSVIYEVYWTQLNTEDISRIDVGGIKND